MSTKATVRNNSPLTGKKLLAGSAQKKIKAENILATVKNQEAATFTESTSRYSSPPVILLLPSLYLLFFSPQEVKGGGLGEQRHLLGAEEGTRLRSHGFSCSVVTAEQQLAHISTCTASTVIQAGSGDACSPAYHLHSDLVFIRVLALITSASLRCGNVRMFGV